MTIDKDERLDSSSKISPTYSSGTYFTDKSRHSEDTAFKVRDFLGLFLPFVSRHKLTVNSYIDVGCGSGEIVKVLHSSLKEGERVAVGVCEYCEVSLSCFLLWHDDCRAEA